ncbi:ABC transporter permease [Stackebrandtia soli]|uniref:ABC transporter permease n=1 Tax=Stackebrandtia soli TaxID=1892856 RepID=UPI0039E82029
MLRFVVRRTLLAVLTLVVVSMITFGLFFGVPADPARIMCGQRCTPEQVEDVADRLGINEPLVDQYSDYMKGIFLGRTYGEGELERECSAPCLGESFLNGEEVTEIVKRGLPVTASIAIGAWALQLAIGLSMGIIAALRRGSWIDKLSIGMTLVGAALPIYFLGALLLLVFRYETGILPQPRYTSPFEDPMMWVMGMILPWFTIALISFAGEARMIRSQMLEVLDEDFIRTSRAKGLRNRVVYWRHALRASITPIVTSAGLSLGGLLGGAVVTETLFGLNGLGKMSVDAVRQLNLPIVMATVLISAVFIVVSTAIVDMLYAVIDPRVRLG